MRMRRSHAAGLSLMECMFATAVLSVSVIAVTEALIGGQMHSQHALASSHAMTLAEALMEEIVSLPYDDPEGAVALGPDSGESDRVDFDNADDFHDYSEDFDELADASGTLLPDALQNYQRSVTASFTSITVPEFTTAINGLNVQVSVTDGVHTWTVDRFIPEPTE